MMMGKMGREAIKTEVLWRNWGVEAIWAKWNEAFYPLLCAANEVSMVGVGTQIRYRLIAFISLLETFLTVYLPDFFKNRICSPHWRG